MTFEMSLRAPFSLEKQRMPHNLLIVLYFIESSFIAKSNWKFFWRLDLTANCLVTLNMCSSRLTFRYLSKKPQESTWNACFSM